MKKVVLDVEDLAVESFEVSNEANEAGTIQAHMPATTKPLQSNDPAVWTCNPLQWTCNNCGDTGFQTYCGYPCSDTAAQYDTCWDTCVWP